MKLGFNTVLFGGYSLETAFRCGAECGFESVELSAIEGMSEHLVLDRWRSIVPEVRTLSEQYGLTLQAIEQPSLDPDKMEAAFQAAAELGIPIVNCGPGGQAGDEGSLRESIDRLRTLSILAADYRVMLCVKAHVGCAIHDTPTTLRALEEIGEEFFGIDFDPSHILRAGEDPIAALHAVVDHVHHAHIRDCRKGSQGPGEPEEQTPGRGDINIPGLLQVFESFGCGAAVDLEIIGAREYSLEACCAIAAEAWGYLKSP